MKKLEKEISLSAAKALISLIPWLGGPITSIWSDIQAQETDACISDLRIKLTQLESKISKEYISSRDYCLYASHSIDEIIKCRNLEKKNALKNIFLNTTVQNINSFDEAEDFELMILQLSTKKLSILKYLEGVPKETNLAKVIEMLLEKTNIEINELLSNIRDLENQNLVCEIVSTYTNGTPYGDGSGIHKVEEKYYLTKKGCDLVKYVSDL